MSKIEVNQISSQCGSTLTIGQSGDTVTLACGATQTGFGRTGTVNWDTTAKTSAFTAVSGNGYFVNTTSGAITLTLPASPSAGDIVSFKDYAYTFATNNLTINANSSPIGGVTGTNPVVYSTNGTSKTFIYVDGTKGWLVTNESTDTSQEENVQYVTATGGTITCCGDYKIHTFTGPGTFCVSCAGNPLGSNTVDYMVVAGGGGGGGVRAGGGGAGGFRESSGAASGCYTASPLGACVSALPITAQGYPITVGGGGAAGRPACNGSNSVFSTITSAGGGAAGCKESPAPNCGQSGGSGGGGGADSNGGTPGGAGNTPPVSPPQGSNGGSAITRTGAGGGGATGVGGNASGPCGTGGSGGTGATSSINATPTGRAGGGGGGAQGGPGGPATCGGGAGGPNNSAGTAGTTNTGGGGGGGGDNGCGGNGGSGVVIIRYRFQ